MCTMSIPLFLNTIFIVCVLNTNYCQVCAQYIDKQNNDFDVVVNELYSLYKDSFENGKIEQTRRLFIKDMNYALHVKKLKEVNGFKTHNLKVEGRSLRSGPIMYIDNPVEAALPNTFLSIDEFKNALFKQAQDQKREFYKERDNLMSINKLFKKIKPDNIKHEKHGAKTTNFKKVHYQLTTEFSLKDNKLIDNITIDIIEGVRNKLKKGADKKNLTKPTTKKIASKKLSTIKKIEDDTKKIKEAVKITTEVTTEKSNENLTTASQVQDVTASIATNATVQNNHENVTNDIIETKTTIVEQNVTDDKLETIVFTETTTVTQPSTTMETTVKTTRTKQSRPFVFMS